MNFECETLSNEIRISNIQSFCALPVRDFSQIVSSTQGTERQIVLQRQFGAIQAFYPNLLVVYNKLIQVGDHSRGIDKRLRPCNFLILSHL